jgi:predicted HicB family RNase H-like nuclease
MHFESNAVAEMAREKTLQFNMRMAPRFKRMAEQAAAADRRSLASLIEKLLADYCRDHGFREEEPKKGRRP